MSPGEKLDPIPDRFILQPPVFHPVVPYVTTIFGGLHTGKMVMLQGVVPRDAHKFQVDFQCGCSLYPRPDIAIHFNPRFYTTKPHVICNTLYGGRWQKEARWPHLALQRGSSFLILFLFGNEEVKVSVNGQHFLHYHYRLPLSRVDTLGIFGDIMVKAVGFLNINPFAEGSREYPAGHPFLLRSPKLVSKPPSSLAWRYSSWPAPWAGGLGRGWRAAEEVPCLHALPQGLWPGQIIVVRGLVLQEPKEVMDFQVSSQSWRGSTRDPERPAKSRLPPLCLTPCMLHVLLPLLPAEEPVSSRPGAELQRRTLQKLQDMKKNQAALLGRQVPSNRKKNPLLES
ncbi:galectin-12 isoform X5 [Nycticebus coucang]|uniref:galectin-12 isoform X5 n=1 Tax=Nycticebus coucang TaxID=9470 RepID=UPI00234D585E|nr:galectin-12 isoform X5 [Nycticebus coucang]